MIATPDQQVPTWWWTLGLALASLLAVICSWAVFKERMPFYQPVVGKELSVRIRLCFHTLQECYSL